MGQYTLDNPDIEDAKGNRASKEKAHQPKNADYAYWHKDGYPVLVGDGSNPSQTARRKHRPAGVPILFKIEAGYTDSEKAAIKEIAAERKKEYDRLYHSVRAEKTPASIRKKERERLKEMKLDRKKSNSKIRRIKNRLRPNQSNTRRKK